VGSVGEKCRRRVKLGSISGKYRRKVNLRNVGGNCSAGAGGQCMREGRVCGKCRFKLEMRSVDEKQRWDVQEKSVHEKCMWEGRVGI
jgi:hypothetical protein